MFNYFFRPEILKKCISFINLPSHMLQIITKQMLIYLYVESRAGKCAQREITNSLLYFSFAY